MPQRNRSIGHEEVLRFSDPGLRRGFPFARLIRRRVGLHRHLALRRSVWTAERRPHERWEEPGGATPGSSVGADLPKSWSFGDGIRPRAPDGRKLSPMDLFLVFAVALLAAVLLSGLAERTVLSTAVLFLVVGFLAGGVTDFLTLLPEEPLTIRLAELALFAVLFTDGMRLRARDLAYAWHLPGRALLLGLPLTLLLTALLAHFVAGLPWVASLLVGAVLSPTDPIFASALVGREEVPLRLRRLLNVESGLNDSLALPIVLVLLAASPPSRGPRLRRAARGAGVGDRYRVRRSFLRPALGAHPLARPLPAV